METPQPPAQGSTTAVDFTRSTTGRITMVGMLTLIMLIPLHFVKSLIAERFDNQKKGEAAATNQWGGNVYVYGPFIKVPYRVPKDNSVGYAYFFPEILNVDANVQTETIKRSINASTVFKAKMKLSGSYSPAGFKTPGIASENIYWEKATMVLKTDNLKGIRGAAAISVGGKVHLFEPVTDAPGSVALETAPFNIRQSLEKRTPFSVDIAYNGSKRISIAPVGKITEAKITSNWPTPWFGGNFFPEKEKMMENGFEASWKISHLNRAFGQQHFGSLPNLKASSFNVDFLVPVSQYQQNERAVKYGFLVIGLTFLVFFLIQGLSKISIHIFHYTMIGLALVMFYTLLISITEHSSFGLAYLIAGMAVVTMITMYSRSILKRQKFTLLVGASLAALYAFLYVIIQMENYALLAGSIGLFLILGAVMYFSRRIDWSR